MKKYLKDLEQELRKNNLSDKEIEEIMADHIEMIESAKNEGLSDEELNEKFGDPKDVAEELSDFSEQASKDEETAELKLTFEGVQKDYDINISLINEDIKLRAVEGDKITVETIGRINVDKYDIKFENNEFHLKSPKMLRRNYFGSSGQKKFIVNLPKGIAINNLKVKLINGDAKMKHLTTSKTVFETNNGDLKLKALDTKELKLGIINGDVSMDTINCDQLKISTISGDLDIKKLNVKEDIFCTTVSGDLKISDSECGDLVLKTVSGDVKGDEFYPKKLSLSSVSGDIKIVNSDTSRPIEILKKRSVSGDIRFIMKENK